MSALPGPRVGQLLLPDGQLILGDADGRGAATTVAAALAELGATRGMIARRGASAWEALAIGASGYVLTSDGTDAGWAASGGASTLLGRTRLRLAASVAIATATATSIVWDTADEDPLGAWLSDEHVEVPAGAVRAIVVAAIALDGITPATTHAFHRTRVYEADDTTIVGIAPVCTLPAQSFGPGSCAVAQFPVSAGQLLRHEVYHTYGSNRNVIGGAISNSGFSRLQIEWYSA